MAGLFNSKDEADSYASYLRTRPVRFLVSLRKSTQDAARDVYAFVPDLTYDHPWTDELLYERYSLTEEEISFVENTVKPGLNPLANIQTKTCEAKNSEKGK